MRSLLLAVFLLIPFLSFSQNVTLVNAGEVLAQAQVFSDSARYDDAIETYLTIPESDTSYVYMLTELAPTYYSAEQYDKVIEVCEKGLAKPSEYKADFLRYRALAFNKKGEPEKALKLLDEAFKEFPTNATLLFAVGTVHYSNKNFEKAQETYFKVLQFSPFHPGSHLNLAVISVLQGRKTHAMLSMGIYLSINNDDNSKLVLINNSLDNQVPDEGSIAATGANGTEKLDQIIKAKIALDKNFDSKIPVNAAVVKQYEMLFQQLSSVNTNVNDPWVKYYLPVYQAIKDQNSMEPFIYHILSSSANETVAKWRKKNEKSLDTFYQVVNAALGEYRKKITLPSLGVTTPVDGYYKNNLVSAVGNENAEGKETGPWIYFHENGQVAAKGVYDGTGNKEGIWNYYNNKGLLKSTENEKTGEVTLFYENGNKREHFFIKDEKTEGEVELYYECGLLSEKLPYKDGERHGKGTQFYPNGKTRMTFEYNAGKASGEFLYYYPNGKLQTKRFFKDDKLEGKYFIYFPNGKVRLEGEYLNDQATGTWKYYYSNGQVDYTGKYDKDIAVGEWKYFDRKGNLIETRLVNEKGELNGDNVIYDNGKISFVNTFKNGMLVKVIMYDTESKELTKAGNDKGTFAFKGYYPTGQLLSEGKYVKGKKEGSWKYYFRNGKLKSEFNYVNGLVQGSSTEHYESGEKKYLLAYKDDEIDGYFQELYSSGQLKAEGYYQNGVHQQQWKTYLPDGKIETDYYYRDDEYHGKTRNYDIDGKLYSVTEYKEGKIVDVMHYSADGKTSTKKSGTGANFTLSENYANGKSKFKYDLSCGEYTTVSKWFPDGTLFYNYSLLDGKRYGAYIMNHPDGKTSVKGQYLSDEQEGTWTYYYENGKKSSEGIYIQGKSDSVWTYYYPNGVISMIAEFADNDRDGLTQVFSPEGVLLCEKKYSNGDLISYRLTKDEPWKPFNGTGKITAYHPNGKIALEEEYKEQLRAGVKKIYYDNGKLCEDYSFIAGDYEGPYAMYYKNGNVFEKGVYKLDEKAGKVEYYDEDGTLNKTEEFKHGIRHGKTVLYKKGAKVREMIFRDGMTEQ